MRKPVWPLVEAGPDGEPLGVPVARRILAEDRLGEPAVRSVSTRPSWVAVAM